MDPVTDVDSLYAVPLEEFVAERKRVAKELRAAGDRDAAAEVAKLPKPTPPAWALNRFAREQPDVVGKWLDVAEALRAASADPGPDLRAAMAAQREATTGLVAAVRDQARPNGRPLSEAMLERVRALLQGALTDPEQGERLRAGRIVEGGEDDAPLLPEPSPGTPEPKAKRQGKAEAEATGKSAAQERKERERAERIAELERRVEDAREQLERREETAAEREEAAAAAAEHLEEARRTLHRSESEASAADDAAQEARAAAGEAERELKALTAKLRKAGGAAPS
jgi:hypothetical protein